MSILSGSRRQQKTNLLDGLNKFQSKNLGIKRAFYRVQELVYLNLGSCGVAFQSVDPIPGQNGM